MVKETKNIFKYIYIYCHHFDFPFLDTNLGIFGRTTGRGKEKKRGKKEADIGRSRRRRPGRKVEREKERCST